MRTIVFQHKGVVGIKSSIEVEGLLNKPIEKGQLGFVIDAKFVDIQPEALEILKKITISCDDIGDIDVYKSTKGTIVFSWLGGPWKVVYPKVATGSNVYDPSLLSAKEGVETPKDFIAFVDSLDFKEIADEQV